MSTEPSVDGALRPLHREAIFEGLKELSGGFLPIDQRALNALATCNRHRFTPTREQIFSAILDNFPAAAYALDSFKFATDHRTLRLGYKDLPTHAQTHPFYRSAEKVLRNTVVINTPGRREERPTESLETAIQKGHFSVEDLATSIFESGTVSWEPFRHPDTSWLRQPNSLVRRLLATDYSHWRSENTFWNDRVEAFLTEFKQRLCDIRALEASLGSQQIGIYFDGGRFRVAPFGIFGCCQMADDRTAIWPGKINVIQAAAPFVPNTIFELESLINGNAAESDFQQFFEENPEFLSSLGQYRRLHAHVVLRIDDGSRLIPDFFLERLDTNFCDICDLKLPNAALVRNQKHRMRFRDTVMEAVAQLTNYRDWFEDIGNRKEFESTYGLQAYRPSVMIIIGRKASFADYIERVRLESNLPNWVKLHTYDDILASARRWALPA